ncbi:MAG: adenine-specific methyltransferase EcoRI family protein [Candidatus Gracilibacteria bacterium]|nr:adenine-specific methyltransferase EcoRI family protein [Candidatus Gracilibacteria bacterium]
MPSPQTEKKSGNKNLTNAKKAKNDEFYTQYQDIGKEMNAYLEYNPDVFRGKTVLLPCDDPEWSNFTKFFAQNFERFGLRKLISTSYARDSKEYKDTLQLSLLEVNSPKYDKSKTDSRGKIYTLTEDKTGDGKVNFEDFDWEYLEGDGDFRSEEVKKLRDEADIIITNPPFSLFREFLVWIVEANKQFVVVSNMNAITYKEVFPLIKENKIWMGVKSTSQAMFFRTSDKEYASRVSNERPEGSWWRRIDEEVCIGINNSCWFTNLDHGRRHQILPLMTESDIIKFVTKTPFKKYDNYDAIEISLVKNIPSDYDGIMGVPISFLDKYNPEQFDILGATESEGRGFSNGLWDETSKVSQPLIGGERVYKRIFIKHKK